MGCPQPSRMPSSMSTMEPTPSSNARMASRRYGTRSRFTTKPVLSLARTGVLPRLFANAVASSKTAGSVSGERTTSTSFMSGTGLKKCSPTTREGRLVVAAISVMESEEVLEAKMASGRQAASRAWKTWRLVSMFSVTTSIRRSHWPMRPSSVVPSSRDRTSAFRSAVTLPFSTPLARNDSILPRPFSRRSSLTSRTTTR